MLFPLFFRVILKPDVANLLIFDYYFLLSFCEPALGKLEPKKDVVNQYAFISNFG